MGYIVEQKPPMLGVKLDVEELLANIQSQLRVNGRAPFQCKEELSPEALEAALNKLNTAEAAYHQMLNETRYAFVEAIKTEAVSEEKMQEFEDAFNHFDANNNNYLEFDEFSASLKAVGVPMMEDEEKAAFGELAEENEEGKMWISRDKYVTFMRNMYESADNAESVVKSVSQLGNPEKMTVADLRVPPIDQDDIDFLLGQVDCAEDGS